MINSCVENSSVVVSDIPRFIPHTNPTPMDRSGAQTKLRAILGPIRPRRTSPSVRSTSKFFGRRPHRPVSLRVTRLAHSRGVAIRNRLPSKS
jgi:hypothetical protein